MAAGVFRITSINRFATGRTAVAVEGKAAVAACQLLIVTGFWNNIYGFTDQADRGHFRAVSHAISLRAILSEQAFSLFSINW
jgi:hypothetical protein